MKIVLTGPKCSGKSTIGGRLAEILGLPFVETDSHLEDRYCAETGDRRSCREICADEGEASFRAREADAAADIAAADWTLATFEAPAPAIFRAFALARAARRRTLLNAGPWRPITPEQDALTDVLVMNESEAAGYFARPDLAQASLADWRAALAELPRAQGRQGRWLVVTLAARGAVARGPDGAVVDAPAHVVAQVDATGAGDAFAAGLACALHEGRDDPLAFANACGAMVARQRGVLAALPTRAERDAFGRATPLRSA